MKRFHIGYVRICGRQWDGGGGQAIEAPTLADALLEAVRRWSGADEYPYALPEPSWEDINYGEPDRGIVLARPFPAGSTVRAEMRRWPVWGVSPQPAAPPATQMSLLAELSE